jgi:hypothetical protein
LAPFYEFEQVENENCPIEERLTPSKGIIEKDDSLYSSSPRQDGECSMTVEGEFQMKRFFISSCPCP